jgi:LPS sulfotransferase NodH
MTQTSYLILATPRSGSTLLGQGLQASGLAGDPKEFFGHKMAFWMKRWQMPSLPAYVARLREQRATPNGVFGAKLLHGQLRHLESLAQQDPTLAELPLPALLTRLFPQLRLVWATRDDKVRQAISWYKARQTGVWGQDGRRDAPKLGRAWRIGDEPLPPGELAFDYDAIAALLAQAQAEDAALGRLIAASGLPVFRVVYEEFSSRYEARTVELLRWLGIDPPDDLSLANPRTVKLADDRTEEWVDRFQDLRAAAAEA